MSQIAGSVGHRGENRNDDVKVVQRLLNKHVQTPMRMLAVDGRSGEDTIAAIRFFQSRVVQMRAPDGRVDPGGKTLRSLTRGAATPKQAQKSGAPLSGKQWWLEHERNYANGRRLEDLEGGFRDRCRGFVNAMSEAGASVTVSSTRRHPIRAHLMHYSWRLSRGELRPSEVPAIGGLSLEWDHGDPRASVNAAREMADLFRLAYRPSLTSNHIRGQAIDMTIGWTGVLVIRPGNAAQPVTIRMGPRSGDNVELQRVGESYGVRKLRSDPPHWSSDGR
jgi:hypothetical protein